MASDILMLDGGLGTSLIKEYGVKFDTTTPLWTAHLLISDQEKLLECQRDFGSVPVDIILTATYQLSKEALTGTTTEATPEGLSDLDFPVIVESAVEIAEKAKHCSSKIALSMGPYGVVKTAEYSGDYDSEHNSSATLQAWHTERMHLFATTPDLASKVAYIALETMPRLDEIEAMRRALAGVHQLAEIPFWMTCVFPGEANTIPSGHSVKEVVKAMLGAHITTLIPWGIGINCTQVWKLDTILRQFESAIATMLEDGDVEIWPALVLYPDGTNGEVFNMDTMAWEMPGGSEDVARVPWERQVADAVLATKMRGKWRQIVVGGCCQCNASDIGLLRGLLLDVNC